MATLVDEWVRGGVTDAVVSPGNRSSLMAVQMALHPGLRLHVFVDERSAGFFGLGLAIAQGRPVVVWTTSGTAVSELRAAVVEADRSRVPLLVATADRPPEQHHVRDWQSTDQSKVFEPHLRWRFDAGVATDDTSNTWRSIGSRSVIEAGGFGTSPGPVHLNLAIREPWNSAAGVLPSGRIGQEPWHAASSSFRAAPSNVGVLDVAKGVISAGAGVDSAVVVSLGNALGWPVIADVRCGAAGADGVITNADLIAKSSFAQTHVPESVLYLGDAPVSKAVAGWLAKAPQQVIVGSDPWQGPGLGATVLWDCEPAALLDVISSRSFNDSWLSEWRDASHATSEFVAGLSDESLSNEPVIAAALSRVVVGDVFLATSMPVRDFDSFGSAREGRRSFANRGASGMDGLISTAAGIATYRRQPMVMICGDLSFLYDLGALWNLDLHSVNLTIVVIDNDGGGIFELLPQLSDIDVEVFETVTATPRGKDITSIASALGARSIRVSGVAELRDEVVRAQQTDGVDVVTIEVDRKASSEHRRAILQRYSDLMDS